MATFPYSQETRGSDSKSENEEETVNSMWRLEYKLYARKQKTQ
jgi:hypothetical protein